VFEGNRTTLKWAFPLHIAYHLVKNKPYKKISLKDPVMFINCKNEGMLLWGESENKIIVPTVTKNYEYFNKYLSVVALILSVGIILY